MQQLKDCAIKVSQKKIQTSNILNFYDPVKVSSGLSKRLLWKVNQKHNVNK